MAAYALRFENLRGVIRRDRGPAVQGHMWWLQTSTRKTEEEGVIIIAADPGLTVGWASISLGDHWDPSLVSAGQLAADDFEDWMAVVTPNVDLLIFETFTINAETARKSPQPAPMYVIGVMKFIARRAGVQIEGQSPGSAKTFMNNTQLKKVGLWVSGQDHARDAIRHLLLGIVAFTTGQAREELLQSLA